MRTPNASCIICEKPLYRRPFELARIRYAACLEHRERAKIEVGITEAQRRALDGGRLPGRGNGRNGYAHRPDSRAKASASIKAWCEANPDAIRARSEKIRGPAHYLWDDGSSALNQAVRRLTRHRKWSKDVRDRDGACVRCGSASTLEAHHLKPFADLLRQFGITSTDEARDCAGLWDVSLGETLCRRCHYAEHGRNYNGD